MSEEWETFIHDKPNELSYADVPGYRIFDKCFWWLGMENLFCSSQFLEKLEERRQNEAALRLSVEIKKKKEEMMKLGRNLLEEQEKISILEKKIAEEYMYYKRRNERPPFNLLLSNTYNASKNKFSRQYRKYLRYQDELLDYDTTIDLLTEPKGLSLEVMEKLKVKSNKLKRARDKAKGQLRQTMTDTYMERESDGDNNKILPDELLHDSNDINNMESESMSTAYDEFIRSLESSQKKEDVQYQPIKSNNPGNVSIDINNYSESMTSLNA